MDGDELTVSHRVIASSCGAAQSFSILPINSPGLVPGSVTLSRECAADANRSAQRTQAAVVQIP